MKITGNVRRVGNEWQLTIEVPDWLIGNLLYDIDENHVSPMVYVEPENTQGGGVSFRWVDNHKVPVLFSRARFEEVGKPKEVEEEDE